MTAPAPGRLDAPGRRRWIWGIAQALLTTSVTFEVLAREVLPGDWAERRWALSEVRGYRAASTALAQAALVTQIRGGQGEILFSSGSTGTGLGIEAQSGPIPMWVPMPQAWSGVLAVDAVSDNGAAQTFRFLFSFVELSPAEWEELVGGCR